MESTAKGGSRNDRAKKLRTAVTTQRTNQTSPLPKRRQERCERHAATPYRNKHQREDNQETEALNAEYSCGIEHRSDLNHFVMGMATIDLFPASWL
jgi:hypothetical protein